MTNNMELEDSFWELGVCSVAMKSQFTPKYNEFTSHHTVKKEGDVVLLNTFCVGC